MATRKKNAIGTTGKKDVDLTSMVQSGPEGAYEALQLFRSRSLRLKSKNDIEGSLKAASDGAICLLENSYDSAGAELAELFVGLLVESNQQVSEDIQQTIFRVDSSFSPKGSHRVEFLKSCVKWTVSHGARDLGDAALHKKLAECLWDINSADKACAYHFAAGEAPALLLSRIIASFPGAEQQAAREQAMTVGLVHFLALENLRDANELYYHYTKTQKKQGLSTDSPLLTFGDYLLQTCRRDAGPLFKSLVNAYASTLDFDDNVPTLLTGPIASKFFGIKPKVNPMMSMLQSMMA
jgi:hypothetical protein